jgi:hypothetical protein
MARAPHNPTEANPIRTVTKTQITHPPEITRQNATTGVGLAGHTPATLDPPAR